MLDQFSNELASCQFAVPDAREFRTMFNILMNVTDW